MPLLVTKAVECAGWHVAISDKAVESAGWRAAVSDKQVKCADRHAAVGARAGDRSRTVDVFDSTLTCTAACVLQAGMPLLVHGEVTDPDVDVFDREATFIERVLSPLAQTLPDLRIVMEHITTAGAYLVPRTRYHVHHRSHVFTMCLVCDCR